MKNEDDKDDDKKPLTYRQIIEKLQDLDGWTYANNKIAKEYTFPSYRSAVDLINRLAEFSERIDHHPDIHIYHKKVVFELQRFDVGGKVTERDFTVAHEIERLFSEVK